MKALLFYENGQLKELPISEIDTITTDGKNLCVSLTEHRGDYFCSIITIEKDSTSKNTIESFNRMCYDKE